MNKINLRLSKLFIRHFLYLLILFIVSACSRSNKTIVIGGVLSTSDLINQNKINNLAELLEAELPNLKFKANETSNYNEAITKICEHKWDLSFAFSPLVASQAQTCNTTPLHLAFVYVNRDENADSYFVGFFSKKDSNINSLNDIEGKSLALKQKYSASGFYIPLFMIYGKTLSKVGFLGTESAVARNVFIGNYDVGVTSMNNEKNMAFGKMNNELKLIGRSQDIPGGSLLVSNHLKERLGEKDFHKLLQTLKKKSIYEKAPKLRTKDGYAYLYHPGYPPPVYEDVFDSIIKKVDSIKDCYLETPAKVFDCSENKSSQNIKIK